MEESDRTPLKHAAADTPKPGLEFNYEIMEDELTCPVCLELYADPLMLPCSHSVCKKCLEDIFDSKQSSAAKGIECPSCRKSIGIVKEKVTTLPRNLALENIVIRYTEERSKSIRKSLSLESPVSELISPVSEISELSEFPMSSTTDCELCESQTPERAAWYCLQCEVAYCHACFDTYHPRRGALARHKVRQPTENEAEQRPIYCGEHVSEVSVIFCDVCKVTVCSLCVCDGEGKHSGHKVIAIETACKKIKDIAKSTGEQTEALLMSVKEQQMKMEAIIEEIQDLHKQALENVEKQYSRLIEDLTAVLSLEKTGVLNDLEVQLGQREEGNKSYLRMANHCTTQLQQLATRCAQLSTDSSTREILARAQEVEPLVQHINTARKCVESVSQKYDVILKEKKGTHRDLHATVEVFRGKAKTALTAFVDDSNDQKTFIIPRIKSPSSPGTSELTPRTQNKYLITWGFSSTSFTGEPLGGNTGWTVTIERNNYSGQWGSWNTGYLFGVGVSSEELHVRDLVGINKDSQGIICSGGSLFFSHLGDQDHLMTLSALPVSVTMSVQLNHADFIIVSYKIEPSCSQSSSLAGKRVIKNTKLKANIFPVFTVSQRAKLLFHTFV